MKFTVSLRNIHTGDTLAGDCLKIEIDDRRTIWTVRSNGLIQTVSSYQGWTPK